MEKKEHKYIQFPLYLLRELLVNHKKTINKMNCFGIYHFSKKMKVNLPKRLYYDFHQDYRKEENQRVLDKNLFNYLLENIVVDEDYFGFIGGDYSPDEDLLNDFKNVVESNISLVKPIEAYKEVALVIQSFKLLGFKGGETKYIIEEAKKLSELDSILPMIKLEIIKDYQNKDKPESEIIQLMFYLGIKSILMKDPFKKVTWEYVIARSFGYPSHKKLIEDGYDNNKYYLKYSKRYHREKIKRQLEENWHLVFYSKNMRGFYVGKEESLKSIIRTAKKSSKKYKEHKRKEEIEKLEIEVVNDLMAEDLHY